MDSFRTKPVFIQAEQWSPGKEILGVVTDDGCWWRDQLMGAAHVHGKTNPNTVWILEPGDWVVWNGTQVEVLKPVAFAAAYEPAQNWLTALDPSVDERRGALEAMILELASKPASETNGVSLAMYGLLQAAGYQNIPRPVAKPTVDQTLIDPTGLHTPSEFDASMSDTIRRS